MHIIFSRFTQSSLAREKRVAVRPELKGGEGEKERERSIVRRGRQLVVATRNEDIVKKI